MLSGAGLMTIPKAFVAVAGAAALSLTSTVKLELPTAVGVPPIAPVDASKDKPAGSEPALTDHVYGETPPEAFSDCEYETPTVPPGKDAAVMLSGATMVIVNAFVAVAVALSFTWTVKLEVVAVAGVPLMEPVEESRDKPAGSEPPLTDHVYGGVPPEAFSACE
jgi:hypothetical protein